MRHGCGENVGGDRLFGIAGTTGEAIRLAILAIAVAWLATNALIATHVLILGIATLIAPPIANWLVRPFADSMFRRLLWGLATAATTLLFVHMVLAILLVIQLRLHGVDEEASGMGAFYGAARFTLMIALPTCFLYAIWGWLRRRSLRQDAGLPGWRRVLPMVMVIGTMIFMASEGAYFDSLRR
jgi:hypothetical protein